MDQKRGQEAAHGKGLADGGRCAVVPQFRRSDRGGYRLASHPPVRSQSATRSGHQVTGRAVRRRP